MPTCRATAAGRSTWARLLHYSFFTPRGLTIHERGLSALVRFISVRAELFARSIFTALSGPSTWSCRSCSATASTGFFLATLEHLDDYRRLTEWSLLGGGFALAGEPPTRN